MQNWKKRVLSVILALCTIAVLLPAAPALAADAEAECTHESFTDGICDACGAYQPAELNADNVYEIGNAGQLLWFAEFVNSTPADLLADRVVKVDAKLTADIDMTDLPWIPIGQYASDSRGFGGTFDGCGHTVSGIDCTVTTTGTSSTMDSSRAGFFGRVYNATIRNLMVEGSFTAIYVGTSISPMAIAGGIVAYADSETQAYPPYTLIENCGFVGTLSAEGKHMTEVGGIAGYCRAMVKNCWSAATVESNDATVQYLGSLVGAEINGAYENCYYDSTLCDLSACDEGDLSGVTGKTTAQFASGEVAYLLNGDQSNLVWFQTIGTDDYPSFTGATVYQIEDCPGGAAYGNTQGEVVHTYTNGFCTGCDVYQPAVLNDDNVYEIGNAGQLYWFAALVNGGTADADAILTADIVINEKVLENGALVSDTSALRVWTPIGNHHNRYNGIFDGKEHTISGLYFNDRTANAESSINAGLFGFVDFNGKVSDLTASGTVSGTRNIGGIVGWNQGSVENCTANMSVTGEDDVGGVVGVNNEGTVTNCINIGSVTGNAASGSVTVGGVVGSNYGTVINCANWGSVTASGSPWDVGGLVGSNYGSVSNCYNVGTVTSTQDYGIGALIGTNNETVTNCYYNSDNYSGRAMGSDYGEVTLAEGKTNAQFASGEVAYLLGEPFGQNIDNGGENEGYPVFSDALVYYGYFSCHEDEVAVYTNDSTASDTKPGHSLDDNGFTDNGDGTHSSTCSVCNGTVTEDHTLNERSLCTTCNTQFVAKLGETLYTDFALAWSDACAASNPNVPLELLTDIRSEQLFLSEDETVKVTGGSITGYDNAVIQNYGTLIVENCDITAESYWGISNYGTATLTGCTLTVPHMEATCVDNDGTMTITDCAIVSKNDGVMNFGIMTIDGNTTIDADDMDLISRGGTTDLSDAAIPEDGWTVSGYASVVTVSTDLVLPENCYVLKDGKVVEILNEGEDGIVLLHTQHTGDVAYVDNGDGTHSSTCTVCNSTVTEDHSTDETIGQTCKGYWCTVCESWYGEASGHNHTNGICSICGDQLKSRFEDVPAGKFYFDPVEWAVKKGITTGATETTFNPDGYCQRGQVVTFLWRAAGEPEPTTTENPFVDVPSTAFYYKAVLWAVEQGITNGVDATHFAPMQECSRAQVVTFLWRAQGSPASDADGSFTDVENGRFYTDAVAWAVENEITNGISATEFGVNTICNRAQVVTFLYRMPAK